MNDYFTFFYVKHFELPMCIKCAIQINLPCLALPSVLNNIFNCFNEFFSMEKFICGFKYSQNLKYQCQLFNFILGHAKMAIYITRK